MNLWPFEHIFSSLFGQISAEKWGKKCSTGQRFIYTEVISYKIYIIRERGMLEKKSFNLDERDVIPCCIN